MQQKPSPVALLIALVVAAIGSVGRGAAQGPSGLPPTMEPMPAGVPWQVAPGTQSVVPNGPALAAQPVRPGSWPGSPAGAGTYGPSYGAEVARRVPTPQPQVPAATPIERLEGAQILAKIGPEVVLGSEVLPGIDEALGKYQQQLGPQQQLTPEQLHQQRNVLVERQLGLLIEAKLLYLDARRSIPEENLPLIEEKLVAAFESSEMLEKMIEVAGVDSPEELDRMLRGAGTSLDRRRRAFVERALGETWLREQLVSEEITYDQTLDYYHEHLPDYERQARACWEELMARFSDYPGRAEARAAIARMGNQVCAGVPLAEVARSGSGGPTAADGGLRGWIHKGSLVCKELDEALFTLPLGQLSPIIESNDGLHIVRVTDREEGGYIPFAEAQAGIRDTLREQRTQAQREAYLAGLKQQIPVWTVFDGRTDVQQTSGREGQPRR